MTNLVRVKLENGAEATVPAGFADRHKLERVDGPPTGKGGQVLAPSYPAVTEEAVAAVAKLQGKALNEALTEAGLSTDGKLAEKQDRLAEHQAAVVAAQQQAGVGGTPPNGGGEPVDVTNPGGNPPVDN